MTKKTDDNYQALADELDDILERLQSESLSIDEVLPAYKRGLVVADELETRLKTARVAIEQVVAKSGEASE